MKGILLSLGILIPTILPSQIRLVPFPGIFSTYIGAHLSKRQFCHRPLSWGLFFNDEGGLHSFLRYGVFVPFLGDLFSIPFRSRSSGVSSEDVFVPFLGDFLSIEHHSRQGLQNSRNVFVPFLGDFLSIEQVEEQPMFRYVFSSPFLGTFFQWFASKVSY